MRSTPNSLVWRRLTGRLRKGGRISHERSHQTFDQSLDSHYLWHSHTRLHLRFAFGHSKLRLQCSLCHSSCFASFRALDVERSSCSTAYFQDELRRRIRPRRGAVMSKERSTKGSKVTLHVVSSLDGLIAKKDNDVSWLEDTGSVYEAGVSITEEE